MNCTTMCSPTFPAIAPTMNGMRTPPPCATRGAWGLRSRRPRRVVECVRMDSPQVQCLLTEARSVASELHDIRQPMLISPGHLQAIAQVLLGLVDACEGLHTRNLALLVAACRQQGLGERH